MPKKPRLLPLLNQTPKKWASLALSSPLILLNDHAHLERKAASNALELLTRWPQADPPSRWVRVLSGVVRDEVQHLARVSRLLDKRGGEMSRSHRTTYASDLHKIIRMGRGEEELMDRLMISALIEARSCERFLLLSEVVGSDPELQRLYESLWASEHGHYKIFLELAGCVLPEEKVKKRWREVLEKEALIAESQEAGPRMHSWV